MRHSGPARPRRARLLPRRGIACPLARNFSYNYETMPLRSNSNGISESMAGGELSLPGVVRRLVQSFPRERRPRFAWNQDPAVRSQGVERTRHRSQGGERPGRHRSQGGERPGRHRSQGGNRTEPVPPPGNEPPDRGLRRTAVSPRGE